MSNAQPPNAHQVAERLVILKYVISYALASPPRDMLQQMMAGWSQEDREAFALDAEQRRDRIWGAVRQLGLWDSLTDSEQAFARMTVLTMTDRQQIDAYWRIESAQVLLWALKKIDELPPLHMQADPDLLKSIPVQEVHPFIGMATLRPRDEIDQMRGLLELWHWRSRTRQLIEQGQELEQRPEFLKAGFHTYDDIVRFTAGQALAAGTLSEVIDEDFVVNGKAFRALTADEWQTSGSIIYERHFALNWLAGAAPGNHWDETPTDT